MISGHSNVTSTRRVAELRQQMQESSTNPNEHVRRETQIFQL